jgi:phosphoenolpyruvate phosphomutase
MIPVAGKTVLRRLVDKFKAQGINDITVVGGYRSEAIDAQGVKLVVNTDWESGSELASLSCALDALSDNTVLLYGDLLFRTYILNNLMDWESDLLVVVDSSPLDQAAGNKNDLAYCSAADDRAMYQQKVSLERISSDVEWQGRPPDGRWIGMLRARGAGRQHLLDALGQLRGEPGYETMGVPDLVNRLVANGHAPQVQYISGHWMDINNLEDLQRAGDFAQGQA